MCQAVESFSQLADFRCLILHCVAKLPTHSLRCVLSLLSQTCRHGLKMLVPLALLVCQAVKSISQLTEFRCLILHCIAELAAHSFCCILSLLSEPCCHSLKVLVALAFIMRQTIESLAELANLRCLILHCITKLTPHGLLRCLLQR